MGWKGRRGRNLALSAHPALPAYPARPARPAVYLSRPPLDRPMLTHRLVAELIAQPDLFDGRIDRGDRQRDKRADHAAELGAYGERENYDDVRQLQAIAVDVRRDQIVLGR